MMNKLLLFLLFCLAINLSFAQTGADTLHFKKVYYFAGTGLGIPLGKTKKVLSPKLFAGNMGLDIALRNPKYYLYPALYLLSFHFNQLVDDPAYNRPIQNGQASIFMLSLAGGTRRQFDRLNTYTYIGPTVGLVIEPRAQVMEDRVQIDNKRKIGVGAKMGVGVDYKFKGFYLGTEFGYMYNVSTIQGQPFHAMTVLVGLKSDITRLTKKVVEIIAPALDDGS